LRRNFEKCWCPGPQNCDTTNGWRKRYGSGDFDIPNPDVVHVANRHAHLACDSQIQSRLQRLYDLGVRKVVPVHMVNNEFGGTALNSDQAGAAQVFSDLQCAPFEPAAGGAAINYKMGSYNIPLFNGVGSTPDRAEIALNARDARLSSHVNSVGLRPGGAVLLEQMKRRGMLIDLEHASQSLREQVLQLGPFATMTGSPLAHPTCPNLANEFCQSLAYPILTSHGGPRSVRSGAGPGSERAFTTEEVKRIFDLGGMMGVGMQGTRGDNYAGALPSLQNDCVGSTKSFAQGYLSVAEASAGSSAQRAVALGSDFNGFDYHMGPRFGPHACHRDGATAQRMFNAAAQSTSVNYRAYPRGVEPWGDGRPPSAVLSAGEVAAVQARRLPGTFRVEPTPEAIFGFLGAPMKVSVLTVPTPSADPPLAPLTIRREDGTVTRVFDYNVDGLANYGLMPDMVQDMRVTGVSPENLGPLFRSAEKLIALWERACELSDRSVSGVGCD
jgi:microsomal dipeptidase-like Zn-dependent dipeptidase